MRSSAFLSVMLFVVALVGMGTARPDTGVEREAGSPAPGDVPRHETARGMLRNIDARQNVLVLLDAVDRNWAFHLVKTTRITLNDQEVSLSDLHPGDMAVVTYELRGGSDLLALEVRCMR